MTEKLEKLLSHILPESEVCDLFSGCCLLSEAVGGDYEDELFKVEDMVLEDRAESCIEHGLSVIASGEFYNMANCDDCFVSETFTLTHKTTGRKFKCHQLYEHNLEEIVNDRGVITGWSEGNISLSHSDIEEI